jgi:hypothetical protein
VNGVWLPADRFAPNAAGAAVHASLHTAQYYAKVNALLLSATTRAEALAALAYIRGALLGGAF